MKFCHVALYLENSFSLPSHAAVVAVADACSDGRRYKHGPGTMFTC